MPPNRNKKTSESATGDAMSDCVLPQDMMLCIFTRLPVKSIHRFKSVCKQLREVLSSPEFAKMHRAQFPLNPENQSVVIGYPSFIHDNAISLLKIETDEEKKPTKLDIPFSQDSDFAEFVGCCNGLLCIAFLQPGHFIFIALCNPALNNMVKCISRPDLEIGEPENVSLGFGYNEEEDDFKVIIIAGVKNNNKETRVEVYSSNSDSWSTINVDFQFTVPWFTNNAIVNGSPYWEAMVDGKTVLLCFDVRRMVFKIVPLPDFSYKEFDDCLFVDLKGDLGALVFNRKNDETVLSLDLWVYYDVGKVGWTKNRIFGPIELNVHRFLQCSKNGKILFGECLEDGKLLFMFDTESGRVKEIVVDGDKNGSFQVHGYTESLAYIKGMEFYD
ncbi:hypothetical protein CASFOL_027759 [Castilleja foliolosa]|uniref:F-box domain-containing protein n=1 Tax=Castilleja foliolosa TaxID=1961234 RepID=A0ABD3CGJ1_9LAMI